MEISNSWVRITNTVGYGALVQNTGKEPIQLAYATDVSSIDGIFRLSSTKLEKLPNHSETKFLFARCVKGNGNLSVQELQYGAGGGSIFGQAGFLDYNDAATSVTPIIMPADTWTDITNDGLGAFTNTGYGPRGVTRAMDSQGRILIDELDIGDFFVVRVDYTVFPTINDAKLEFRYKLGAGAGEYTLPKSNTTLDEGAGFPSRQVSETFIYAGDVNTVSNPITIQAKISSGGTLVNAGFAIGITKR